MRYNVFRLLTCGLAALLALGLGACHVSTPGTGALTPTPATTSTPITTAPPMTTATSGPVTVTLGKAQYAPAETVEVSIHNGLSMAIFARDERSDCTVVDLERWVNGSWQVEAPCVNMQPAPHVVKIASGAVFTQRLAPDQSDFSSGLWPAGTYRVAFDYVTSADQPFGQSTVVYSASFMIG